jgi:hypothetical protein
VTVGNYVTMCRFTQSLKHLRLGVHDEETSGNKPVWMASQVASVRAALPAGCELDGDRRVWRMDDMEYVELG